MAEITYIGPSNARTMAKTDWEYLNVGDQEDVTWEQGATMSVSEDAAAALLERMPDEFKKAEEDMTQPSEVEEGQDTGLPAEGQVPVEQQQEVQAGEAAGTPVTTGGTTTAPGTTSDTGVPGGTTGATTTPSGTASSTPTTAPPGSATPQS